MHQPRCYQTCWNEFFDISKPHELNLYGNHSLILEILLARMRTLVFNTLKFVTIYLLLEWCRSYNVHNEKSHWIWCLEKLFIFVFIYLFTYLFIYTAKIVSSLQFSKILVSNKNSAFSVVLPTHVQWFSKGFSNIRFLWKQLVTNFKSNFSFSFIALL